MDIGFETIGNATLICHDKTPVLVTDPWLDDSPYFGSWALSNEIPDEQLEAIKQCEFVWTSHGHPDHLSVKSLRLLSDIKLLLPDHVGGRITDEMRRLGFDVTVLQDRTWTKLSPRISVLCIPDYNQDAVLLINVDGTLVVNLNDTSPRGWGPFVKKTVKNFETSFLLAQFGFGDADMINFFDDSGVRIEPRAARRLPVGPTISRVAESFGIKYIIPFSSLHKYQRSDSSWATQYLTPLDSYGTDFQSDECELLPAYVRYHCSSENLEEIRPAETTNHILEPEEFGDDWSETLDTKEAERLKNYFSQISHLSRNIDFLNFRVGGEDNIIELRKSKFQKGIVFETPRGSLMKSIRYEIFDDLLIGNFTKTQLVGKWPASRLYPDFTPYVAKYADNGRAKTAEELREYFKAYRNRAPIDYLRHRMQFMAASIVRNNLDASSSWYQLAQKTWWKLNKLTGA